MEQENVQSAEELEADGYYGDDEAGSGEMDLSFLDEEDEDDTEAKGDRDGK